MKCIALTKIENDEKFEFPATKCLTAGVARFSTVQHTKTGKNIPNDHKMQQMALQYATLP
jgi:hypothetical protein